MIGNVVLAANIDLYLLKKDFRQIFLSVLNREFYRYFFSALLFSLIRVVFEDAQSPDLRSEIFIGSLSFERD